MHCIHLDDHLNVAAEQYSTHVLCQYIYELAKRFHTFYETCPILKESATLKQQRIAIIQKVKEVMGYCLAVLGLSAPTSM